MAEENASAIQERRCSLCLIEGEGEGPLHWWQRRGLARVVAGWARGKGNIDYSDLI